MSPWEDQQFSDESFPIELILFEKWYDIKFENWRMSSCL